MRLPRRPALLVDHLKHFLRVAHPVGMAFRTDMVFEGLVGVAAQEVIHRLRKQDSPVAAEVTPQFLAGYQEKILAREEPGEIEIVLQLGEARLALVGRVAIGVIVHHVDDIDPHLFEHGHEFRWGSMPAIALPFQQWRQEDGSLR